MDRRTLLIGLGVGMAWLSTGGCARPVLGGRGTSSGGPWGSASPLGDQLAELSDPVFHAYSQASSIDSLYSGLVQKGVISEEGGINHEKLTHLARHEPLVRYEGFYYTQTELDLYALAYLHTDTYPAV